MTAFSTLAFAETAFAPTAFALDGSPPPAGDPPIANGIATPVNGVAPLFVTCTDLSVDADSVLWTFGAGEGSSTLRNPTYTYETPGTFTITLTATNAYGTDEHTLVVTVAEPADPLPPSSGGGAVDILRIKQHRMRGKGGR